ncbi:MAG: holo-[acyl-carrier-protein] synthase [Actinomycetota bacterium]
MRGVGIDAVDIERFRVSLERTPTMRTRLFTPEELASLGDTKDPVPSLAARFAVREATMKAMGVGLGAFDFHDVSVVRTESGAPRLQVRGRALDLAGSLGINDWHVSITHTATVAMAVVAAL